MGSVQEHAIRTSKGKDWTVSEAAEFYGWSHLAPSTQRRKHGALKRYGLLGRKTLKAGELPKLTGSRNTRALDARILNATFRLAEKDLAYYVPAMRRRVYELPDTNDIAYAMAGKHGIYVALMAYAGLRAGEACAADLPWLDGNRLEVKRSICRETGEMRKPKTEGDIRLPEWLVEMMRQADFTYPKPKNLAKWMQRRRVTPHQLRHFYATEMMHLTKNMELLRRQMRHTKVETTMAYYVEVGVQQQSEVVESMAKPSLKLRPHMVA